MPRHMPWTLALAVAVFPAVAQAQDRFDVELRVDAAFPTQDLGDASLDTGFGFEGTIAYRIQPHLSVYGGWDWHRFSADASFAGAETDFEETGYAFGLRFRHPLGSGPVAIQLHGGGTFNHIEVENSDGDAVADSKHGLGWEAGAGLAFRIGDRWQLVPAVRYRALSRDLTVGAGTTPVDLRYIAVGVGFSRSF